MTRELGGNDPASVMANADVEIDNPPEDNRVVQEEQSGPVLPLVEFRNIDDVVARANASAQTIVRRR